MNFGSEFALHDSDDEEEQVREDAPSTGPLSSMGAAALIAPTAALPLTPALQQYQHQHQWRQRQQVRLTAAAGFGNGLLFGSPPQAPQPPTRPPAAPAAVPRGAAAAGGSAWEAVATRKEKGRAVNFLIPSAMEPNLNVVRGSRVHGEGHEQIRDQARTHRPADMNDSPTAAAAHEGVPQRGPGLPSGPPPPPPPIAQRSTASRARTWTRKVRDLHFRDVDFVCL